MGGGGEDLHFIVLPASCSLCFKHVIQIGTRIDRVGHAKMSTRRGRCLAQLGSDEAGLAEQVAGGVRGHESEIERDLKDVK
jgi:hypothetical protein